jgi:hypothetical protein
LGAIRSSAVERRQIGEPVCFYLHGLHLFEQSKAEMGDNSESGKQDSAPRTTRIARLKLFAKYEVGNATLEA